MKSIDKVLLESSTLAVGLPAAGMAYFDPLGNYLPDQFSMPIEAFIGGCVGVAYHQYMKRGQKLEVESVIKNVTSDILYPVAALAGAFVLPMLPIPLSNAALSALGAYVGVTAWALADVNRKNL